MKLLYITNGITGIGGLERVLSIKASYLAEQLRYDVHIITLNEKTDKPFYTFSPKIKFHNVKTRGNGLCYLYSYITGINRIVNNILPDIISVCDDGLKGLYVPVWIKKQNASIIYERHASLKLNQSVIQSFLIKLGGLLYDRVIVLTKYNLTEWIGHNLKVIPNPLSFIPKEKSKLDQKKIICVGSLSHNKGYDLLIEAWSKIAMEFPDWEINVYGKGEIRLYEEMIQEKGINNICFCGPTNNVMEKMMNASLLVLPSRSEGFGMVLIEAMACGLPCVAFDCPCGPRDIIQNGENGLLVPAENVELLAESIKQLITDKEMLYAMGANACKSIGQFSVENVCQVWNKLFHELKK